MERLIQIALQIVGLVSMAGFFSFAWVSIKEGERIAASRAMGVGVSSGLVMLLLAQGSIVVQWIVFAGLVLLGLLMGGLLLFPGPFKTSRRETPSVRFDERDIVFARHDLEPATDAYDAYYQRHPDLKKGDDHTRTLPGLMSHASRQADPLAYAAAEANFYLTDAVRENVDGATADKAQPLQPDSASSYVKGLARYLGAYSVGICKLKPAHVYSHAGRGTDPIGEPLPILHSHAIAFTVPMDYEMMTTAPAAPVVVESSRQYVEAARISIQLAAFCRALGYPARAHIDANYQVIAPLVARDAGLGEIGRIGLLITPGLGPRVRIGVVTTNMPLCPDPSADGRWIIDFCRICKKCADNCPSRSIPAGEREEIDGALRWKLNAESCFAYWNVEGTDCGICMKVCPFSHPDTWIHNAIRRVIRRSPALQKPVLLMDDFFYGRKPGTRPDPSWMRGGMGIEG